MVIFFLDHRRSTSGMTFHLIVFFIIFLFAFSSVLLAKQSYIAIRFNRHTIIILSINILPASDEVGNSVSHFNKATGFPGAQGDMLQLTLISTLVNYFLDIF